MGPKAEHRGRRHLRRHQRWRNPLDLRPLIYRSPAFRSHVFSPRIPSMRRRRRFPSRQVRLRGNLNAYPHVRLYRPTRSLPEGPEFSKPLLCPAIPLVRSLGDTPTVSLSMPIISMSPARNSSQHVAGSNFPLEWLIARCRCPQTAAEVNGANRKQDATEHGHALLIRCVLPKVPKGCGHEKLASMPQMVRWGVLGAAKIALVKVIPGMQRRGRSRSRCDRVSRCAKRAADNLGPKAYGSYEELLADPEIDAIYNPLPNHMHVSWSCQAAEAGKHVLCEKPIGLSTTECRDSWRFATVRV